MAVLINFHYVWFGNRWYECVGMDFGGPIAAFGIYEPVSEGAD
jgi:hypothetical protein